MKYTELFNHLHPAFFEKDYVRSLPEEEIFEEQVLDLHDFCKDAADIPCPEHITFGFYKGDITALQAAVREVEDDWAQYFTEPDEIFCAFDGDKIVSFCILDDCGEYEGLHIGAPGCVGTIPAYRKRGIGLKMVQKATEILKERGCDLSWIHYTAVGHWYARLGYRTVLRWNAKGFIPQA